MRTVRVGEPALRLAVQGLDLWPDYQLAKPRLALALVINVLMALAAFLSHPGSLAVAYLFFLHDIGKPTEPPVLLFMSANIVDPPDFELERFASRELLHSEIFWRDHQKWLKEKGYLLRLRYYPDWVGSWGPNDTYFYFEDGQLIPVSDRFWIICRTSCPPLRYSMAQ